MQRLSSKSKTILNSILFVILATAGLIFIHTFNEYKLKTNLMAYQEKEMKASA